MRNDLPIVSIIIPVYNVAKYLAQCIDSIMAQDEHSWELILVNDGSTDNSGQICDTYAAKDSRITVVHKDNEGVSIARNLGITLAKAEWICFVDSDDWVEPHYLSDMLALAKNEKTVVYGSVIHDYAGARPSVIGCNYIDGVYCNLRGENVAHFIEENRIIENGYPVAKIFHRGLLKSGRLFDPSISLHEDHIFVLGYLLAAEYIALSSTPNYHYMHRTAVQSLSKKKHPTKNLVIASDELLNVVRVLIVKFSIKNKAYIRYLYTILGLNQLVRAALEVNNGGLSLVGEAIRSKKDLFYHYYSPNHFYVRLVPFLFFIHLDKCVLWINRLRGKHI